jgi:chemotaxis protein MotA
MPASQTVFRELPQSVPSLAGRSSRSKHLDGWFLVGLLIAVGAAVAAISSAGIGLKYFLQPTGAVMVLGGTFGVILVAAPSRALLYSARRLLELFSTQPVNREVLIEKILTYARASRYGGMAALQEMIQTADDDFLREALQLATDVKDRAELQAILETGLRMRERQGEADAKTLEVAGGFAPTLGILGTVVGLIEVLRRFSNVESVSLGIGTAFVSTIYGLGLANLVLLPAAHRIRARVAETFEVNELIIEGVLCLFDQLHPTLIRDRLSPYLRKASGQANARPAPALPGSL